MQEIMVLSKIREAIGDNGKRKRQGINRNNRGCDDFGCYISLTLKLI
jgi:hypothetical protein